MWSAVSQVEKIGPWLSVVPAAGFCKKKGKHRGGKSGNGSWAGRCWAYLYFIEEEAASDVEGEVAAAMPATVLIVHEGEGGGGE